MAERPAPSAAAPPRAAADVRAVGTAAPPAGAPAADSLALARLAAEACDDRKAVDIRLIHVEEISSLADWFVLCSGLSDVQVRAIARSVEDRLESEAARLPLRREGLSEGRWVVLDYGELIVHVLAPHERAYYDLESFWGHGEQQRYLSPEAARAAGLTAAAGQAGSSGAPGPPGEGLVIGPGGSRGGGG